MMQASPVFREFGAIASAVPALRPRQVEALKEDAYERGLADGRAQALDAAATRAAAALEELTARLDGIATERGDAADAAVAEAGRALATVVRSLCPGLSALGLADRARRLLENELLAAPRPVTIRAAPDIADALDEMDAGIAVERDDTMPGTRLDLSWPEGGATVDAEALATEIMGLAETLTPESESDPVPGNDPVPENTPVEENPHD